MSDEELTPAARALVERFPGYESVGVRGPEAHDDPTALNAIARIVGGEDYLDVLHELAPDARTLNQRADGGAALTREELLDLFELNAGLLTMMVMDDIGEDRAESLLYDIAERLVEDAIRPFVERHGTVAAMVAYLAPQKPKGYGGKGFPVGTYASATFFAMQQGWSPLSICGVIWRIARNRRPEDAAPAPPWRQSAAFGDSPSDQFLRVRRALVTEGDIHGQDATGRGWRAIVARERDAASRIVAESGGPGIMLEERAIVELVERDDDAPRWVIEELVVAGEFVLLAAPAFAGKTPFVLDMACAVATGGEFLGRATSAGRVLYVTREASAGELRRWVQRLGYELDKVEPSLLMLSHPTMPDLATDAGGAALVSVVERFGPFALVIVDTMGRFVFGPENATETYAALHRHTVDRLQVLDDPPAVVFVDHLSAEDSPRPRGSTAKLDTADAVWIMKRTKGARDADMTEHRLSHAGRVRIPRPSPILFSRTFDDEGACRFTARTGGAGIDLELESAIESAIADALPVASGRELEGKVRAVLGDGFGQTEFRRTLRQMVDAGEIAEVPGPRRAVGYDLV